MTTVVKVESEKMVADSKASGVNGNIFQQNTISGSNQAARVKQDTYDVWEDDWSN